MKTAILYAAGIVMLLLSTACNHDNKKGSSVVENINNEAAVNDEKPEEKNKSEYAADSTAVPEAKKEVQPSSNKAAATWDKKIIKTANVAIELKDYNLYNNNLHNSIKRYGAYIASEEQTQNTTTIENTVTIKVPVEQFDNLMNSFSGDGIKVLEKKISAEDVTAEVIDTKGRIETKKEVRQQYIALLKQAKNMKDILEVQNEINGITEELESASGRVQYLSHQAAFSTIHLRYFQYLNSAISTDEEPGFFAKLKSAFIDGAKSISSFVIGLISIWPAILFILFAIIGIRKWHYRKESKIKIQQ